MADPYDDILQQADALSAEELLRLSAELAVRAARKGERHSIMELKGLGKEIWRGVDANAYVAEERNSWNG